MSRRSPYRGDIGASAGQIFAILVRPTAHRELDGSGMLRSALDETVISRVGDVFAVNMFNDQVGDYVMENRVVEFEPQRRIVWEPVMRWVDKPEFESRVGQPADHQWGWQLETLGPDRTRVTEFFDCSRSPDWLQEATKGGEQWRPVIEASLDNLQRQLTGS